MLSQIIIVLSRKWSQYDIPEYAIAVGNPVRIIGKRG